MPSRLDAAQALFVHDRVLRNTGVRTRPSLPDPLPRLLRSAQRGPVLRRAARVIVLLLNERPFTRANARTSILCGFALLHLNGVEPRIPPIRVLAALRRWSRQPPEVPEVEAWLTVRGSSRPRRRAGSGGRRSP